MKSSFFLHPAAVTWLGIMIARSALSQGTAFTYSGRLTDGTAPANGSYELRFALHDLASGGSPVASPVTNAPIAIADGLFTVTLDFGPGAFPGANRWLDISVRTNGSSDPFTALVPRQLFTATPYAITAGDVTSTNVARLLVTNNFTGVNTLTNTANLIGGNGARLTALNASQLTSGTVPNARLFGVYGNALTLTNPFNVFVGSGAGLTGLDATELNGLVPSTSLSNAWRITGNSGTTAGFHFLGTTDNRPLELRVNNQRALRIDPDVPSDSVNIVAGSVRNFIASGVVGATVSGGGAGLYNSVRYTNSVADDFGTVAGGRGNAIATGAADSTISGGRQNQISTDSPMSLVAGGSGNFVDSKSTNSTIGGGLNNRVAPNSAYSTISGGNGNNVGTNSDYNFIGGGFQNSIAGDSVLATIVGGDRNSIGTNAHYSFIGGGDANTIATNARFSVIVGGSMNNIGSNLICASIGGGNGNRIRPISDQSTIAGGLGNIIGTNSPYASIGGGFNNNILGFASHATIAGGVVNDIGWGGAGASIGGGNDNNIGSAGGTIAGGLQNDIGTNATEASIGGGRDNNIADNAYNATIGGGSLNDIGVAATFATIAGGANNNIAADSTESAITGGSINQIGTNSHYSSIGGGHNNNIGANSSFGTIPGGDSNFATNRAFAAGTRAKANHLGAIVLADSTGTDLVSTNADSITLRARGGYRFFSNTTTTLGVSLAASGGSWTSMSDRNAKENFDPVNPRAVLDKVAALPVSTWNYKEQTNSVRHIGPMAQDFKAAFGVGETETGITTIDADGVALAAIQGLNLKLEEKQTRIDALEKKLADLQKAVEALQESTHPSVGK